MHVSINFVYLVIMGQRSFIIVFPWLLGLQILVLFGMSSKRGATGILLVAIAIVNCH